MSQMKVAQPPRLKIIPLGGVDEFGKNITVVEYGDDILVVDCGSIFPKEEMLGVDLVIPDVTYLIHNREKVRGMILTHGHEDHIGAVPYVQRQVRMPIYGTKLTLALVDLKLREHQLGSVPLNVVEPGGVFQLGCFTVRFIHVNHSIPGAVAVAIATPAGTIIFSGDFKVDFTPIQGEVTDLTSFAEIGSQGVLAFLCESTNIERKGHTMSETTIAQTFMDMFRSAKGRVFVAMFASNVHRLQMVVDTGLMFGRRVCFIGRAMTNVTRVAISIGELHIAEENIIDVDELDSYPDENILIVTTGSQGEAAAGLTRMANMEHRKISIHEGDTVILSAHPIPGNEKPVARVINQLYHCGANVIHGQLGEVHVSGHACQEEIKLLHALIKPKYFIPIHGEYANLWQHAVMAEQLGMDPCNIIIPEIGQEIEMTEDELLLGNKVPTGGILVDGLGIGDVGNVVLRDRKHLGQDGLMIVSVILDRDSGQLLHEPEIISRGFIYLRDNDDIMEASTELVRAIISDCISSGQREWGDLRNRIKDELHRFLQDKMKRNPMILPVVTEI